LAAIKSARIAASFAASIGLRPRSEALHPAASLP
jgi:hypothetical protein